jgi:hypothetical protein
MTTGNSSIMRCAETVDESFLKINDVQSLYIAGVQALRIR